MPAAMIAAMLRITLLAGLLSASMTAAESPFPAAAAHSAPRPEKKPKDVSVHGDTRMDEYFWLREKKNPDVLAHLKAENAHTEAVLAPTGKLQETLYQEMVGRLKETDTSAETPYAGWLYYVRTEKGKQHPIHCRRKDAAGSKEEVLVDVNELARGREYAELGAFSVSPGGGRLLYTVDWTGGRDFELFIRDLATGAAVPHKAGKEGIVSSAVWAGDDDTVCWVEEEAETKRAFRLHRTSLKSGATELLWEEKDELFDLSVTPSRDHAWIIATSGSKTTTEVRAWKAGDTKAEGLLLRPRETDHDYRAAWHNGRFLIATNKDAKNFRVVTATPDKPGEWKELIPHRPKVRVGDLDVFQDFMAIMEREDGLPQLSLYDFASGKLTRLPMPEKAWEIFSASNLEYAAKEYRFEYESMITPTTTFAVNAATGERRIIRQREVPGYKAANYVTHRLWAKAADGTEIPLSVVHRADLDRFRPQPLHLYAYGSYGISESASFGNSIFCLLDRGWIHVTAHIRGGGEMGEEWREAGRMAKKMTTFTDFTACADWLVKQGWTAPDRLVASGGSAGGMLMGAVVNLRPDLFRAVVLDVPFVDVLNTMLDDTLPLTTSEYVEWGNPNVKEEYGWMRAWSPYDNLKSGDFPHLLVNVGLNDSQVPYWEGAKYAARVRELNTSKSVVLVHCDLSAGHGGVSGRYDALREMARTRAFMLEAVGGTK